MTIALNWIAIRLGLALANADRISRLDLSAERRNRLITRQIQHAAEIAANRNAIAEQSGEPFERWAPNAEREIRRVRNRRAMKPMAGFSADGI